MELFGPDNDRRVIPRWRDSQATLSSGELDALGVGPAPLELRAAEFEHKLNAWNREHSLEAASELVSSALVLGHRGEALDAASAIVGDKRDVTPAARALAEILLSRHAGPSQEIQASEQELDTQTTYARIHALRLRVIDDPRNATAWVDLSRAYSTLGQHRHSAHAMQIALSLAPTNRFVLRSAVRLFVHLDEPDRAHDLLYRNHRTRSDPWLMSAEIAVASIAERTPLLLKRGRQLLTSASHAPKHLAELASAVATVEMSAGGIRKARQLFKQSLVDPTENAVAQAGWASNRMTGVDVAPELMTQSRSYEAQAIAAYQAEEWRHVIGHCGDWLRDEPFSSRPAAWGSYLAMVAVQDHFLAERFAARGLQANPDDALLRNNLVVALADQGQIETATAEFARIQRKTENKQLEAALLATEGLLKFRSGAPDIGRSLYREAIRVAGEASAKKAQALAAVHLAREEVLAKSPEAPSAVTTALRYCEGVGRSEVLEMLKLIVPVPSEPQSKL